MTPPGHEVWAPQTRSQTVRIGRSASHDWTVALPPKGAERLARNLIYNIKINILNNN